MGQLLPKMLLIVFERETDPQLCAHSINWEIALTVTPCGLPTRDTSPRIDSVGSLTTRKPFPDVASQGIVKNREQNRIDWSCFFFPLKYREELDENNLFELACPYLIFQTFISTFFTLFFPYIWNSQRWRTDLYLAHTSKLFVDICIYEHSLFHILFFIGFNESNVYEIHEKLRTKQYTILSTGLVFNITFFFRNCMFFLYSLFFFIFHLFIKKKKKTLDSSIEIMDMNFCKIYVVCRCFFFFFLFIQARNETNKHN